MGGVLALLPIFPCTFGDCTAPPPRPPFPKSGRPTKLNTENVYICWQTLLLSLVETFPCWNACLCRSTSSKLLARRRIESEPEQRTRAFRGSVLSGNLMLCVLRAQRGVISFLPQFSASNALGWHTSSIACCKSCTWSWDRGGRYEDLLVNSFFLLQTSARNAAFHLYRALLWQINVSRSCVRITSHIRTTPPTTSSLFMYVCCEASAGCSHFNEAIYLIRSWNYSHLTMLLL